MDIDMQRQIIEIYDLGDGCTKKTMHQGEILREVSYYKNGELHRVGDSAQKLYDLTGKLELEIYFENGKIHRLDGPAYIRRGPKEDMYDELFYINNKKYDKLDFFIKVASALL